MTKKPLKPLPAEVSHHSAGLNYRCPEHIHGKAKSSVSGIAYDSNGQLFEHYRVKFTCGCRHFARVKAPKGRKK